jgi:CHAT domain-containing protein
MSTAKRRVVLAQYHSVRGAYTAMVSHADLDAPVVLSVSRSEEEISKCVQALGADGDETALPRLDASFHAAFEPFLAPLFDRSGGEPLVRPGDLLWIVPHRQLHHVPLHAVELAGEPVLARNPVCYAPSASLMQQCRRRPRRRLRSAAVFGDSQDDLARARMEAKAVAAAFGTTALVGSDATKAALVESLSRPDTRDVIHVACHAYFDEDAAELSSLILAPPAIPRGDSDTLLSAEEILGMRTGADTVVLSACESGVSERAAGDELFGLAPALLIAGAASIVVSLWSVADESACLLMESFYSHLRKLEGEPYSKALALRAAALDVRSRAGTTESGTPFSDPSQWAPFALVGSWD